MTGFILAAGGVCVALAAIGVVGRKLWRIFRRIDHFMDDWFGEPARPGVAARPGVMERLCSVERQLTPNGGNSHTLADGVVRLEQHFGTEPEEGAGHG